MKITFQLDTDTDPHLLVKIFELLKPTNPIDNTEDDIRIRNYAKPRQFMPAPRPEPRKKEKLHSS